LTARVFLIEFFQMKDLIIHIRELNNRTRAWIAEDPANRGAGMLAEDLEHWNRYGVHTVEQFEHYMAAADYSDMYKDKYGYRPNWARLSAMSIEELRKWIARIA
jgi:hypothetical protein